MICISQVWTESLKIWPENMETLQNYIYVTGRHLGCFILYNNILIFNWIMWKNSYTFLNIHVSIFVISWQFFSFRLLRYWLEDRHFFLLPIVWEKFWPYKVEMRLLWKLVILLPLINTCAGKVFFYYEFLLIIYWHFFYMWSNFHMHNIYVIWIPKW